MKAKTAAAKAKQARIKKDREEQAMYERERKEAKLRENNEAPMILSMARKAIAKAVREGCTVTDIDGWNQVVADILRDEGYFVFRRDEEVNMGDSAAPGMVHITSTEISW